MTPAWSHPRSGAARQLALRPAAVLRWLTANIGVHHVHHLNSRIPVLPARRSPAQSSRTRRRRPPDPCGRACAAFALRYGMRSASRRSLSARCEEFRVRANSHRHPEGIDARHRPGLAQGFVARARDQFALLHARINLRECRDLAHIDPPRKMHGMEIAGMIEARRRGEFGQRVQRRAMEIVHALGLVRRRPGRGCATGSCVATPVGQRSVWQLSDWMQPSENMKPRAELHQSAPSAIALAISKAVTILPRAPMRMRSRAPMPTSALCTKTRPSRSGMPR